MKDVKQGMVIPFDLPASRMRRSAAEYRRHGQVHDALTLLRRAAIKDDSTNGWYQLAAELRHQGCWEAAASLLGRVLSREDHLPCAWLEMGRCQAALGNRELAVDCLYHQLQEDPWSPESDAARQLLGELEDASEKREPRRASRLARRTMEAWRKEDMPLVRRRLRRAEKVMQHPEELLCTSALLSMLQGDGSQALRWAARAVKHAPDSPRTQTLLATTLYQLGRPRAARAFLRRAIPLCSEPRAEDQFISAAWTMDAWPEMTAFLAQRCRITPLRTTLLSAKATMCCEQGRRDEALSLWREILAIDPDDRRASVMLSWVQRYPELRVAGAGPLAAPIIRAQQALVEDAQTDPLRHGSETRRALDWFAVSGDEKEEDLALKCVREQPDRQAETAYLRELLARPGVSQEMSRRALIRLAELGCEEPLTMLIGRRYTTVQCQRTEEPADISPWGMFLPLLLHETARYRRSAQIAAYAARVWKRMSAAQRAFAGAEGGYLWCKGMEVMWLCSVGQEDKAVQVVRQSPLSIRRISRVMRAIAALTENGQNTSGQPEKEIQHEVHQF